MDDTAAVSTRVRGAQASVLARLWGAYAREPVPGLIGTRITGADLVVTLSDGRTLRGPAAAAVPFADVGAGLQIHVSGDPRPWCDPSALLAAQSDPGTAGGPTATPDGDGRRDAVVRRRFARELRDSVANLALARAGQPSPTGGPPMLPRLAGDPDALARLEQSVVDGHPLHPLCRTRTGMSAAEVHAYAPEHRPVVDLVVLAVPADRWHTTGTGLPPRLAVHPWQRDHVLDRYPGLRPTGETIPARPLMSLRTLAPLADPGWHLKTAVDVQMTSAVRTVSAAAAHNGPALSALLATAVAGLPIEILAEPAAGMVLVDGEPCRSLAVIRRRAPRLGPDEIAVPYAVFAAPSPASGRPLLTEAVALGSPGGDPGAYVIDLVTLTLPPLLRLLHHGVALEAHGQNTLVVLRAGRPVRLAYRDFGGVRVSPRRLAAAGIEAPALAGDIVTDDPGELRTKLAAAVLSTLVAELVATAGRAYGIPPGPLWRAVAAVVRDTYRTLPAPGDRDALLGPTLPIKAMTAMRLSSDPLTEVWAPVDNPLARWA